MYRIIIFILLLAAAGSLAYDIIDTINIDKNCKEKGYDGGTTKHFVDMCYEKIDFNEETGQWNYKYKLVGELE